ncbi:FHA domain-containing protein [Sulfurisoma sediminicola]|uniref:Type III secretion system (T3SS) inner membrane Yop/YscD-like protein n=1 Tax=Sulfurisoma sediminicola TaxID=1381557 RepID=A0A497XD34_9PROT|nr:FHA domain-containing protein [Sulfurisoma sediminicola]RLJ64861.1 type III secretion system (T3SS) inner membrane Yop/YscD-like protein [Sulfurisoma sediminicola]
MLIYVSLALVAVVVIAAVMFRMRSRGGEQPDQEQAHPASITIIDAPATPKPAAEPQPFDSDATMVYMRPGQATTPAAPRKSEDVPTMTLRGVHLVGLTGKQKGQSFPIAAAGITLGRSSSCDIVLTDSCVSGQHAWIGMVEGKVTLRDMQSTNGTFLNAQLRTSISEVPLRPGDTIFIGGHLGEQFRFEAD